ncbi:hypothetical protein N7532_004496 [Penicillium argentinense]|uniref:Uncharacterized protein n=1 Tax=Penicillium argentinense TaxID=1131581 RepID=A0A9W9KG74_9EURO|nr:uncharacterized protein N7532_004496 [Penicillium argentinense]KAJ5103967.1 hypothetical protein N7532_004496 [Penicillium argentinense]
MAGLEWILWEKKEMWDGLTVRQMRRKQKQLKYSRASSDSGYPSSLSSGSTFPLIASSLTPRLTWHSIPFLTACISGLSPASPRSPFQPRDHLESLFLKHGYPTPVSLSSLRDLTATSSTYNPPSPSPSPSPPRGSRRARRPSYSRHSEPPIDAFGSLSLSSSSTRPIPIPRRRGSLYEDDLPVTPLTGRFDKDSYFEDWERASLSAKSRHFSPPSSRPGDRARYPRMRSDHSPFISPVGSPIMSPRRPSSPQPARSRTQNSAKSVPGFHLGNLPRFHPAVYQADPSGSSVAGQPPSPRQSRVPNYRPSSSSRDSKWQYRDFFEGTGQSPSAPRLDPLSSPGPVTPLALEAGDYLAAGSSGAADQRAPREPPKQPSGPTADFIDKLIARENEKNRLKRQAAKGR